jgi:predicted Fe-Mo cluster-binding NifX family protein
MKKEIVAIPVFQERVSPLLDVADRFVIYEIAEGGILLKSTVQLDAHCERLRIKKLGEIGVSVIIGGAVSGYTDRCVSEQGIRLVSWVSGAVDEIIELYLRDELPEGRIGRRRCRRDGEGGNGGGWRRKMNKEGKA